MKHLKKQSVMTLDMIQKNTQYLWIAGIFLVAAYYNLVISPVEKIEKNKDQSPKVEDVQEDRFDIDGNVPSKTFRQMLHSRAGDWYRIGLVAKALDNDEVLHIIAVSSMGKEKEVGKMNLDFDKKSDAIDQYSDFVFETDGEYEDVIIRKDVREREDIEWTGGRVELSGVNVSRLDVTDNRVIQKIQPTLFGNTVIQDQILPESDSMFDAKMPEKTHFLFGQTFIPNEGSLVGVRMNLEYNNAEVSSNKDKYRIELREYDSNTKKVSDKVVARDSFSLSGLEIRKGGGSDYVFNLPAILNPSKQYFVGISDNNVKRKGILHVKELVSDKKDNQGYVSFIVPTFSKSLQGIKLLTRSKIEDNGSSLRYTYQSNHTSMDLVDLFETSGDVWFDDDTKNIMGSSDVDTSFTYKIDMIYPFESLRLEASQLGDKENQIRLEYSYDGSFWKSVPFEQVKGESQEFDLTINNDQKTSLIFMRVSFSGERKEKQDFGLDVFRVTATLPKAK